MNGSTCPPACATLCYLRIPRLPRRTYHRLPFTTYRHTAYLARLPTYLPRHACLAYYRHPACLLLYTFHNIHHACCLPRILHRAHTFRFSGRAIPTWHTRHYYCAYNAVSVDVARTRTARRIIPQRATCA